MSIVLGHRGLGEGADENTLESLRKAIQLGADGVEVDTRLTKDNVIVLCHDPDLSRTLGLDIEIKETTYRELKEEELIHEERLALLEQVYLELPEDAIINVELKDPEVAEFVVPLVSNLGALDRTIFSSFIHDCLPIIRRSDDSTKIGLLFPEENSSSEFEEIVMSGIRIFAPYSVNLPGAYLKILGRERSRDFLGNIRSRKTSVILCLNDLELFRPFSDLCDLVITDRVKEFSDILADRPRADS